MACDVRDPIHPFAGEIRDLKNSLYEMQQKKERLLLQIKTLRENMIDDENYMRSIDLKIAYLFSFPGLWSLPEEKSK